MHPSADVFLAQALTLVTSHSSLTREPNTQTNAQVGFTSNLWLWAGQRSNQEMYR